MDLTQAEASSLTRFLGCEERLSRPLQHILRHASSVIGDLDHHVPTRLCVWMACGHVLVENNSPGSDGHLSAGGHRVAGIDGQVEQRGTKLRRIDVARASHSVQCEVDVYRLTQHA